MPDLINKSDYAALVVPLISARGHNVATVIVKATFDIGDDGALTLAPHQEEIAFADALDVDRRFIVRPSDLVDFKPVAEVIVLPPANPVPDNQYHRKELGVRFGDLVFSSRVEGEWPFGPLARGHESRRCFAGTYDDAWRERRMPLLPIDFDPRFQLAARRAQQLTGYARGDESLVLANFHGRRRLDIRLPGRAVVISSNVLGEYFTRLADLDTVLLHADMARLELVWRSSIVPRQKLEEVGDIVVDDADWRTAHELFAES